MIDGDPSWSGPLAGECLKLNVYHILEPEIKKQIPEDVFDDELMLLELAVGDEKIDKIASMMETFRSLLLVNLLNHNSYESLSLIVSLLKITHFLNELKKKPR